MQVRGVLLEDLTLVQQSDQLPNLVFGEVQNVIWIKVQVLHEEVNDLQSSFLDQNFSISVLNFDFFGIRVVGILVCLRIFLEQFLIDVLVGFLRLVISFGIFFIVAIILFHCLKSRVRIIKNICLHELFFLKDVLTIVFGFVLGPLFGLFGFLIILNNYDNLFKTNSDVLAL